jgi:hypothetical protein
MTTVDAVEVSFNSLESDDESANTMFGDVPRGSQRPEATVEQANPSRCFLLILAKGGSCRK